MPGVSSRDIYYIGICVDSSTPDLPLPLMASASLWSQLKSTYRSPLQWTHAHIVAWGSGVIVRNRNDTKMIRVYPLETRTSLISAPLVRTSKKDFFQEQARCRLATRERRLRVTHFVLNSIYYFVVNHDQRAESILYEKRRSNKVCMLSAGDNPPGAARSHPEKITSSIVPAPNMYSQDRITPIFSTLTRTHSRKINPKANRLHTAR